LLVNGLASSQISPADWRAHVAWVGQDAVLFKGSLRENLLMASPQVSDERFMAVLRLCGLDLLAAAHPQGLDMPLGEGGQALSGGQRQWVALARALLSEAPVVFLDEPTSAMDVAFEQALMARLRTELDGRLVLIATHRPGPLVLADRLLVLDKGRVLADGPRDTVLQAIAEGRVGRVPSSPDRSRLQEVAA
jgi:ATP-binding cassette subfamily C protein LapB